MVIYSKLSSYFLDSLGSCDNTISVNHTTIAIFSSSYYVFTYARNSLDLLLRSIAAMGSIKGQLVSF